MEHILIKTGDGGYVYVCTSSESASVKESRMAHARMIADRHGGVSKIVTKPDRPTTVALNPCLT